jgi:hypothetical protein
MVAKRGGIRPEFRGQPSPNPSRTQVRYDRPGHCIVRCLAGCRCTAFGLRIEIIAIQNVDY